MKRWGIGLGVLLMVVTLSGAALYAAPNESQVHVVAAADLGAGGLGVITRAPTVPAKLSSDEAVVIAKQHIGAIGEAATKVSAEYTLFSMPGAPVLNQKALKDLPVYLVTFEGVTLRKSGVDGGSPGAAVPNAKLTAVIDAQTGEWILAVGR